MQWYGFLSCTSKFERSPQNAQRICVFRYWSRAACQFLTRRLASNKRFRLNINMPSLKRHHALPNDKSKNDSYHTCEHPTDTHEMIRPKRLTMINENRTKSVCNGVDSETDHRPNQCSTTSKGTSRLYAMRLKMCARTP